MIVSCGALREISRGQESRRNTTSQCMSNASCILLISLSKQRLENEKGATTPKCVGGDSVASLRSSAREATRIGERKSQCLRSVVQVTLPRFAASIQEGSRVILHVLARRCCWFTLILRNRSRTPQVHLTTPPHATHARTS